MAYCQTHSYFSMSKIPITVKLPTEAADLCLFFLLILGKINTGLRKCLSPSNGKHFLKLLLFIDTCMFNVSKMIHILIISEENFATV